jgi:hypothetical protein
LGYSQTRFGSYSRAQDFPKLAINASGLALAVLDHFVASPGLAMKIIKEISELSLLLGYADSALR